MTRLRRGLLADLVPLVGAIALGAVTALLLDLFNGSTPLTETTILTIALVVVTSYYAWQNRVMARAMARQSVAMEAQLDVARAQVNVASQQLQAMERRDLLARAPYLEVGSPVVLADRIELSVRGAPDSPAAAVRAFVFGSLPAIDSPSGVASPIAQSVALPLVFDHAQLLSISIASLRNMGNTNPAVAGGTDRRFAADSYYIRVIGWSPRGHVRVVHDYRWVANPTLATDAGGFALERVATIFDPTGGPSEVVWVSGS